MATLTEQDRARCGEHGSPLSMQPYGYGVLMCGEGCRLTGADLMLEPDTYLVFVHGDAYVREV